ncbi:CHRD domain-containing protein [Negadavirga shengliensis]|uniref:CHRD domain-containing protein n=1 Tax=Negadavirga shengliensis TaxID=1389218 RepID=A0ABV9T3Y6_9BACT
MEKQWNVICLCLLVGGMLFGCQAFHEEVPVNSPISEGENLDENVVDANARKGHRDFYGAFLIASEEVAVPPVVSQGSGAAFFEAVDGKTAIKFELRVANMTGIVAAHIHLAPMGVNGPVVADLIAGQAPSALVSGVIAEGIITADHLKGPFLNGHLDTLMMALNEGRAYVNVHTTAFPGGEIRGQISMVHPSDNGNYNTRLTGDQEVPAVDTKARGVGNFKFNSDNSSLSFQVNVAQLENVRFAHIHIAKVGVSGPIVVDLRLDRVDGPVNGVYAKGEITDANLRGMMTGGDLKSLREAIRTGNAYVNVHTDDYPPGEIRGQL